MEWSHAQRFFDKVDDAGRAVDESDPVADGSQSEEHDEEDEDRETEMSALRRRLLQRKLVRPPPLVPPVLSQLRC